MTGAWPRSDASNVFYRAFAARSRPAVTSRGRSWSHQTCSVHFASIIRTNVTDERNSIFQWFSPGRVQRREGSGGVQLRPFHSGPNAATRPTKPSPRSLFSPVATAT